MDQRRYRIHGLVVDSDIELPAAQVDGDGAACDVRVALALGVRPSRGDKRRLLASRDLPFPYRIWATGDEYLAETPMATFRIDRELRQILATPSTDCPPEILSLLLLGPALTAVVTLAGGLVLHASAVQSSGGVVVFAGPSGSGKSTLSALLSRPGHVVVADDALRLELVEGGWIAHPAAREVRLRQDVERVAGAMDTTAVRRTADGRLAARPAAVGNVAPGRLACLLFPRHVTDGALPEVRLLSRRDVVIQTLRNLRVGSWCDPAILAQQTRSAAALARSNRAFELLLPPGDVMQHRGQQLADLLAREAGWQQ